MERPIALGAKGSGYRRLALALLCGLGAVTSMGCERQDSGKCLSADCETDDDHPPGTAQACQLETFEGPLTGTCIPYVDAGWHTALVKMAFPEQGALDCPDTAPFAGMAGQEIPAGDTEPRLVIACSVNPLPRCPSVIFGCVPEEVDYPPCVLQSGSQRCPDPYPIPTAVQQPGAGGEVTVCCEAPEAPQ